MPYTLYEMADGREFYYDTTDNSLYNNGGELLSLPPLQSDDWYKEEAAHHGKATKTNQPLAVRLLLGHACNYSCTYCMQKDIGNPLERARNYQLDKFKEEFNANLDLSRLKRVELWGGEPFLYWKDMVEIMDMLDHPDREFFISTNGSPLSQKHVDYFAQMKAVVLINISHDGPGHERLRGEDILKNIKKVNIIQQLKNLYPRVQMGFGCVVSKSNYDLFAINDYFKTFAEGNGIENLKITYIPAKNYDATNSQNSADHVINGEDLVKFNAVLGTFINACMNDMEHKVILKNNIVDSEEGVLQFAMFLKNQAPITTRTGCGADSDDVLSLDLKGNVRLCPHTDESYISGHINKIELVDISKLDLDRKNNHCFKCPFKRLCRSSCPIKFPDEVFLSNCRFEKVWWGNIQSAAMKLLFGQEVKMMKVGLDEIKYH